jgi:hypothetical protein
LTRNIKFVAAVLAATMLAGPLSAMGLCAAQGLGFRHCGQECPMMKSHVRPELQVTEFGPSDGSCCQISSAPPVAKNTAFTNQSQQRAQGNQLEHAVAAIDPLALHRPAYPETVLPPSSSSHQALLCVFLI